MCPLPDIDSIDTYNGAVDGILQDYSPVEDPQTDQPAAGASAHQASTAMMTRTITRAYCTFVYNGSTTTVTEHDAVWGNNALYAPTVSWLGTGQFRITWPTTVTDVIGGDHSVNMRRGWGQIENGGTLLFATVGRNAANQANVLVQNTSSTNTDPTGLAVDVWII